MKNAIISSFKEKPKTRTAWWAMGLGVASFFVFPALGIFAAIISPFLRNVTNDNVGIFVGFGVVIIAVALSISALVVGILAYKKGERSWAMWIGLIPAVLVGLFWIFMIIGELVVPH